MFVYFKDYSKEYIELIHLLSDNNFWVSLSDKKKLDKKVFDLLIFLKKLKETN